MNRQDELGVMSEFDINRLIADILGRKFTISTINSDEPYLVCPERDEEIDYCNNPIDIMPIAFENRIGIDWSHTIEGEDEPYFKARGSTQWMPGPYVKFEIYNKNPLRAICIVFILMKEAKS